MLQLRQTNHRRDALIGQKLDIADTDHSEDTPPAAPFVPPLSRCDAFCVSVSDLLKVLPETITKQIGEEQAGNDF